MSKFVRKREFHDGLRGAQSLIVRSRLWLPLEHGPASCGHAARLHTAGRTGRLQAVSSDRRRDAEMPARCGWVHAAGNGRAAREARGAQGRRSSATSGVARGGGRALGLCREGAQAALAGGGKSSRHGHCRLGDQAPRTRSAVLAASAAPRPRPCGPGPSSPSPLGHEPRTGNQACVSPNRSGTSRAPRQACPDAARSRRADAPGTSVPAPRPPSSSPSAAPEAAVRGPHSYRESFSHKLFNCSLLETIRLTVLWSESRMAAGNPLYEFFQQNTMLTYAGPTKQIRTWWAGPQGNRTRVPLGEWHRPEEAVLGASGVLAWAAAARTGTGSGHLSPHQAGTPTPLAQHVMCHS